MQFIFSKRRRFPRHIRQSIRFLVTLASVLFAIFAILLVYDRFAVTLAHKPGYLTSNVKVLAVMPIRNYAFNRQVDNWGQFLSASLTDELARHMGIRVIDTRSVKQAEQARLDRAGLFHALQTDYLLTGGVMLVDDQVVLTLHLYEAGKKDSVWTRSFAAKWQDSDEFMVEVIESAYNQLNDRIFPQIKRLVEEGKIKPRVTPDPDALRIYYEAKAMLKRQSPQSNMMATLLLHQAIKQQSDLARAHTAIAEIEFQQLQQNPKRLLKQYDQLKAKMDLALALDKTQGLPYGLMAEIAYKYKRNMPLAEVYFQQSIALSPSNADVRFRYARFLAAKGEFFDAMAQLHAGKRLNPMAYPVLEAVWIYTLCGEFELAEAELDKLFPLKHAPVDYYIAAQNLYQNMGDELQAFAHYLNIFQTLGFANQDIAESMQIYEKEGLKGVNLWLALEKQEQLDIGQYLPPLSTAYYLAAAKEYDQALEFLKLAEQEGQLALLWVKSDPRFTPLQKDPEFIEIMKKAGYIYFDEI